MVTKTLTITEDVYKRLKALKLPDESFSDELARFTHAKESIMDCAGSWKNVSAKEISEIKEKLFILRKSTRL